MIDNYISFFACSVKKGAKYYLFDFFELEMGVKINTDWYVLERTRKVLPFVLKNIRVKNIRAKNPSPNT